jgi:endonuclease/exonuclease/phosphatase family metal-dependent hydrolase
MHVMRIAVQNVWARYGDWPRRREVLRDGLRAAAPDLAAFIEPVKTDAYDQVEDLLGDGYEIVYQARRHPEGVGGAIASRWPIRRVHELDLRVSERTTQLLDVTLAAEIDAPEPIGRVLFVAANPKWEMGYEREREQQALIAARFAENYVERHQAHVVLAGDFDATPDSASVRFWRGLQSLGGTSVCYRDAWGSIHTGEKGHTFTPRNPLVTGGNWPLELGRRIDYVMVRCLRHGPTLDVLSCERIFDEPVGGVWASDHFGVIAELSVQAPGRRSTR